VSILVDFEEELYRRGNFELIFPLKSNVDYFEKFFESSRYNNHLIWAWLRGGSQHAPIFRQFKRVSSLVV
jgi:hypothetical protein